MKAFWVFLMVLMMSLIPAQAQEFHFRLSSLQTTTMSQIAASSAVSLSVSETLFGTLEPGFVGSQISKRLLVWALPWMGAGILGLWFSSSDSQKGFWGMSGAWGFVNGAIALVGLLGAETSDYAGLRTTLFVNAGLDVLYLASGLYLLSRPEETWRGGGVAILIQGGFLLAFDVLHALLVPVA
jgi:hypothetical protein